MKTPSFWYRQKSLRAHLLSPLGQLYRAATLVRRGVITPYAASVPILCIGNIVAGGAGKTPTALALAQMLIKEGQKPVFVSRGYGGSEKGPLRIDLNRHTAADVGDEALLLAQKAPCWIARQREAAIREAEKEATVIILDDGLQNPKVAADVALLVIDGEAGFGNQRLIPAGPLRETISDALPRIDAIVLIGEDLWGCAKALDAPILQASLKPALNPTFLAKPNVLAFAGIGRPSKFYESCRKAGLAVALTQDFPDHYRYSASDLENLTQRAQEKGLRLITTAKDFVRVPTAFQPHVAVLAVDLVFADPQKVKERVLTPLLNKEKPNVS